MARVLDSINFFDRGSNDDCVRVSVLPCDKSTQAGPCAREIAAVFARGHSRASSLSFRAGAVTLCPFMLDVRDAALVGPNKWDLVRTGSKAKPVDDMPGPTFPPFWAFPRVLPRKGRDGYPL